MLEQELASIIKFTLGNTGNPAAYYYKIPQSFCVPSAYFPRPEIISGPDTFNSYGLDYAWYIKLFSASDEQAYDMGLQAVTATRGERNLIPLINTDGEAMSGKYVRVNDPSIKMLDDGACQFEVTWTSRRPYNHVDADLTTKFDYWGLFEAAPDIDEAMEAALEKYLTG